MRFYRENNFIVIDIEVFVVENDKFLEEIEVMEVISFIDEKNINFI